MSRARSVPAFIVENSAPWMNGTAIAKARNELVGKPCSMVEGRRPAAFTVTSSVGKISGGITYAGWRSVRVMLPPGEVPDLRRVIELTDTSSACLLLLGALERAARLGQEHVVEARRVQLQVRRRAAPRRRALARRRRVRTRRLASRTATPCGEACVSSPNCASTSATRSRCSWSAGTTSTVGRPIDAFSSAGVPSATILPVVDDPDAVAEDVRLLEVLRGQEDGDAVLLREPADLLPERVRALRVEAGGRLVEEEEARPVDEREREVEAALHAAGVRRAPCGRRRRQADALEQLVAARCRSSRGTACSAVWRRRCSRPVRIGSSAASCSAAPIARRTFGPSLDDVEPGDGRRARGRRQQRRQHVDGRRLPGAVRAEEAVDLASATRRSMPATARTPPLNSRASARASMPFDGICRAYPLRLGVAAIGPSLGDELLEQAQIVAFLRVPEDSDGEAAGGVLDRLDRVVVGSRADAEALAEPAVALVVVRLDCRSVVDQRAERRVRQHLDAVLGEGAGNLAMALVTDPLGDVLLEVAAERDVQHLRPAADGEHRHVPRERGGEQRQLGLVALRADRRPSRDAPRRRRRRDRCRSRRRRRPRRGGRASPRSPSSEGGIEQRAAPGSLHGAHVGERDERGGKVPHAPGRLLLGIRCDPDDRAGHVAILADRPDAGAGCRGVRRGWEEGGHRNHTSGVRSGVLLARREDRTGRPHAAECKRGGPSVCASRRPNPIGAKRRLHERHGSATRFQDPTGANRLHRYAIHSPGHGHGRRKALHPRRLRGRHARDPGRVAAAVRGRPPHRCT